MKDTAGFSQWTRLSSCDCHASGVVRNNVAFNDGMIDLPNSSCAAIHSPLSSPHTHSPPHTNTNAHADTYPSRDTLAYPPQFSVHVNIIHICWVKSNSEAPCTEALCCYDTLQRQPILSHSACLTS